MLCFGPVLGWPLGDTSLNCGSSLMLNMLGEADDDQGVRMAHDLMAKAYQTPGAALGCQAVASGIMPECSWVPVLG